MAQLPAHGRSAGLQCLRPECCAYMEGIADDKQGSLQPVYLCSDCAHDRACMVPDAIKEVNCLKVYLQLSELASQSPLLYCTLFILPNDT
jgi:hypothetical protein